MSESNPLLELIQIHERAWGQEQYPGRPSLATLLNSPIVVMWYKSEFTDKKQPLKDRFMLTVHPTWEDLDTLVTNALVLGHPSHAANWKLSKVFFNQKPVRISLQVQVLEEQ